MQSFNSKLVLLLISLLASDGLPAAVYKSVDRLRRQADEYQFGDGDDAITVETLGTSTIADAGNLTERFGYGFQTTFQTGWPVPSPIQPIPNNYGYPAAVPVMPNNYYPSYSPSPYGPPLNYYDYNNGYYYYPTTTTTTTTARPTTTTTTARPPYGNFYAFYFRDSGALNETDFRSSSTNTDDGFNFGSR